MPNATSRCAIRCLQTSIAALAAIVGGCGGDETPDPSPSCDHPYRLTNEGVNGQVGIAGQSVPSRLTVRVTCANSNALAPGESAHAVTWTVAAGGGLVNGVSTLTGSGHDVQWQLGPTLGDQSVRVDYVDPDKGIGSSTTFHATAIEGNTCQTSAPGTAQTPANGERVVTANEIWTARDSPHRGTTVRVRNGAVLTVEAGAGVCIEQLEFSAGGRLFARGTPSEPILFSGPSTTRFWSGLFLFPPIFGQNLAAPSVLSHARVENPGMVIFSDAHPTEVSDVVFKRSLATPPGARIQLALIDVENVGASSLERVVVDGFGAETNATGFATPAVHVDVSPYSRPGVSFRLGLKVVGSPGDGLSVNANGRKLDFASCEFSANGGNGVVGLSGLAQVSFTQCNFVGNALAGLRNVENFAPLSATANWWGDAGGPAGPSGDGVVGDVDASSPLAQPVSLGY